MKTILVAVIMLVLGGGVGYFVGWDHGFEKASLEFEAAIKALGGDPAILGTSQEPVTESPDSGEIASDIVGVWRSIEDAKFTREFMRDGTVIDRYEGDSSAEAGGQWTVLISPAGEPPPFPIQEGVTYLKLSMLEEVLYFSVAELSQKSLALVYLDRGGVLEFTRER